MLQCKDFISVGSPNNLQPIRAHIHISKCSISGCVNPHTELRFFFCPTLKTSEFNIFLQCSISTFTCKLSELSLCGWEVLLLIQAKIQKLNHITKHKIPNTDPLCTRMCYPEFVANFILCLYPKLGSQEDHSGLVYLSICAPRGG